MELHVLSDRPLGSIMQWQQAIDAEGFPLRLPSNIDLVSIKGFVPVDFVNRKIGFECYHDDAKGMLEFLGESNFDHRWRLAFGFRWLGTRPEELQAAWMAATAYAAATGGIIFDHEEGKLFTPEQARETVRNIARDLSAMDTILADVMKKMSSGSRK